jgi:phosphoglycolate phosphatase
MRTPKHFSAWFDGWPELVCLDLDGTLVDSVPE